MVFYSNILDSIINYLVSNRFKLDYFCLKVLLVASDRLEGFKNLIKIIFSETVLYFTGQTAKVHFEESQDISDASDFVVSSKRVAQNNQTKLGKLSSWKKPKTC